MARARHAVYSTNVYLDEMGHLWAGDRERLHEFAASIGMKREWFQDRPILYHYDLTTYVKRAYARAGGATTITSREMVGLMRNARAEPAIQARELAWEDPI